VGGGRVGRARDPGGWARAQPAAAGSRRVGLVYLYHRVTNPGSGPHGDRLMSARSQTSRGGDAESSTATASFAVVGHAAAGALGEFVGRLRSALGRAGLAETEDGNAADLVINVVDEADPKPFRRRSRGTFVVGLYQRESHSLPEDYPMLVRALANIALC